MKTEDLKNLALAGAAVAGALIVKKFMDDTRNFTDDAGDSLADALYSLTHEDFAAENWFNVRLPSGQTIDIPKELRDDTGTFPHKGVLYTVFYEGNTGRYVARRSVAGTRWDGGDFIAVQQAQGNAQIVE